MTRRWNGCQSRGNPFIFRWLRSIQRFITASYADRHNNLRDCLKARQPDCGRPPEPSSVTRYGSGGGSKTPGTAAIHPGLGANDAGNYTTSPWACPAPPGGGTGVSGGSPDQSEASPDGSGALPLGRRGQRAGCGPQRAIRGSPRPARGRQRTNRVAC